MIDPHIQAEVCRRIAGGESLREICETDGFPAHNTICDWLRADRTFADQYARARETQADGFFDEIVKIADTDEDPARARVRIDARKWVAGKMRPKVYGEKVEVEHSGNLQIESIKRVVVDPKRLEVGGTVQIPALVVQTVGNPVE